ncbi:hypothetical protein XI09_04320 [Bradyrhizobium sp. CCBAU 11386]|uniref:hypothetical protein n=1 Tax=unclassified Bradyrhizobium TaxID=2631580 RepID=UPI002303537E|nr:MULTISPECIES: hypothetical protein [unclassified Bradyrhizobium]MDA9504013.1 hypothetical protein [Bradyrhizobium sp. CCBAU 11386]MDA9534776.1 hypothetical protein [Bradyrhizobium sp. CCBAU 21362]
MTLDRNILESGAKREALKLEEPDCQASARSLRAHASAIEALRACYVMQSTVNTVALYDAAAALFGSDFDRAEYHEVE